MWRARASGKKRFGWFVEEKRRELQHRESNPDPLRDRQISSPLDYAGMLYDCTWRSTYANSDISPAIFSPTLRLSLSCTHAPP